MTTWVCVDNSGSTSASYGYWSEVQHVLETNKDACVVFWNTCANIITHAEAMRLAKHRHGTGGTAPACFVPLIPKTKDTRLIIISDGQISQTDVDRCTHVLGNVSFGHVEARFIETCGEINMSVACSFVRDSPHSVFVNGTKITEQDSSDDISLCEYMDDPHFFLADAENLLKRITVKCMGRPDIELRNNLFLLQKNLLAKLSHATHDKEGMSNVRLALENGNEVLGRELLAVQASRSDNCSAKRIEAIIAVMGRACVGTDFSFANLAPGRLLRADEHAPVEPTELPHVEVTISIQCLIFLDSDSPALLVKRGEPVFNDIDKRSLEWYITNPLSVLDNPYLMLKIKQRIDHSIGVKALQELYRTARDDDFPSVLYKDANIVSPVTRANISSFFVFENSQGHADAVNYALANIFFGEIGSGQKLVGIPELWLAVIRGVISDIPYLEDNVRMALDAYLRLRLLTNKANLTLSMLPIEPMVRAPLDVCLWYAVQSPRIITNCTGGRDRLRNMGCAAKHYLDIVKNVLRYPVDVEWTLYRIAKYLCLAWMFDDARKHLPRGTRAQDAVRSLYQKSIAINNTLVFLDGPADTIAEIPVIRKLMSFGLSKNSIFSLAALVDVSKKCSDVLIPLVEQCAPTPQSVENFHYTKNICTPVPICPKTLRPYMCDISSGLPWQEQAERTFGIPVDKQISLRHRYIEHVHVTGAYPTKDAFILWLAEREATSEKKRDTLPTQIVDMVDMLFKQYDAVKPESASEFVCITESSRPVAEREKMERT